MMKVVIDRATWINANHLGGNGMLRNEIGNMCCLGFACKQLADLSDEDITFVGMPEETQNVLHEKLATTPLLHKVWHDDEFSGSWFDWHDSPLTNEAQFINDCLLSDAEREERLITVFTEHGVELTFEGEYKD